MPLTPEDVQDKQFATVRLKEGYDMEEVDDFLDEVQAELERLRRENDELRDKLAAVTRGGGLAPVAEAPARQSESPTPPPSSAAAPPAGAQSQPSDAAAKVLALAQRTADELVAEAKAEADRLLTDARQRADKIDAELKAKVNKIETEARQKAEAVEREAAQRKQDVFGALEAECAQLERRRDELRDFEREYRSRLKAYLQSELRKLETGAVDEVPVSVGQGAAPAGAQPSGNSGNPGNNPAGQGSNSGSSANTSGGGSARSVASLLEDDQR